MTLEGVFNSDNVLLGLLAIAALAVGARFLAEDIKQEMSLMERDVEEATASEDAETTRALKTAFRRVVEHASGNNGHNSIANVLVFTGLIVFGLFVNWIGRTFYCKKELGECFNWGVHGIGFSAMLVLLQLVVFIGIAVSLYRMYDSSYKLLKYVHDQRTEFIRIVKIKYGSNEQLVEESVNRKNE